MAERTVPSSRIPQGYRDWHPEDRHGNSDIWIDPADPSVPRAHDSQSTQFAVGPNATFATYLDAPDRCMPGRAPHSWTASAFISVYIHSRREGRSQ